MFSKVRILVVSSVLVAMTLSVPTAAHAADCSVKANAGLPECVNALVSPNKAGTMQEVPQDAAWAQKNSAKNAPATAGAPQKQGKAKRQWTHTVQAKCAKGAITLNLTEGTTCPQGFKKK
jgi:hypothetical protein